jgi:diguanylate cyclase (GGDEF)-like protein
VTARRAVIVADDASRARLLDDVLGVLPALETHLVAPALPALDELGALVPDVLIVDHHDGTTDALVLLDGLAADPVLREIPVVVVAAEDERAVCYAALDRGARDFLVRPVDPDELRRRVVNVLAVDGERKRLSAGLAEEARLRAQHEQRLQAVWSIAGASGIGDDAYLQRILDEGTRGIAAPVEFSGTITHVEEGELVFDIVRWNESEGDAPPVGARLPLGESMLTEVLRDGHTGLWSDVALDARFALVPRRYGRHLRALIASPFQVGAQRYVIAFFAAQPHRFSAFDYAYVEILASLCVGRLQQRAQADRLAFQSGHDALTGILTRAALRAAAGSALRSGGTHALVVLDVDRLRTVNDTLGHQVGDAVLVEVAAALNRVDERDVLGRLGGDSFGILMPGVSDAAQAEHRVRAYADVFAAPLRTGDRTGLQVVKMTASVGVALAPEHGSTFDDLLARADAACYQAKLDGRACWRFFDQGVPERFALERRMQSELDAALVRGELELYFQPHVELTTGTIVGAEALLRWNHPTRGLVMPSEFLAVAQGFGLMRQIGLWVMEHTVELTSVWRRLRPGFRAWFNLSALELTDPTFLAAVLAFDGELDGVGVEITETVAMRDVPATNRALATLRQAGLAIALDDFGLGPSSLAQLKSVRVDLLKIDGAIVAGLPEDAHDVAVVDATVSIAERFGYELIAEGVETRAQQRALERAGCRWGQGYLFGRPCSATDFARLLDEVPPQDAVQAS